MPKDYADYIKRVRAALGGRLAPINDVQRFEAVLEDWETQARQALWLKAEYDAVCSRQYQELMTKKRKEADGARILAREVDHALTIVATSRGMEVEEANLDASVARYRLDYLMLTRRLEHAPADDQDDPFAGIGMEPLVLEERGGVTYVTDRDDADARSSLCGSSNPEFHLRLRGKAFGHTPLDRSILTYRQIHSP